MTTAGSGVKGFDGFLNMPMKFHLWEMHRLMICCTTGVSLFSDLTRAVTMQNLFHDGGFSNTGIGEKVMENYLK